MRRCPDCGFRAEDTVCPLCGVKMRSTAEPIKTHTHRQDGERCALPNKETKPAPTYRPQQSEQNGHSSPTAKKTDLSGCLYPIWMVLLLILFRGCALS